MKNKIISSDCDLVLEYLENAKVTRPIDICNEMEKRNSRYTKEYIGVLLSILVADEFANNNGASCRITIKGRTFFYTDSYSERGERWEVQRLINIQQSKLNQLELDLKGKTFWIAVISALISLSALIVSLF